MEMFDGDYGSTRVLPRDVFDRALNRNICSEFATIVHIIKQNHNAPAFSICQDNRRNRDNITYAQHLLSKASPATYERVGDNASFLLQGHDCPLDIYSLAYQSKHSYNKVCLVPDFYYLRNYGYRDFYLPEAPSWAQRESKVFWRGSTTGCPMVTFETLDELPRYQMVKTLSDFGKHADVGFYAVFQAPNEDQQAAIWRRLENEGLTQQSVPLADFVRNKFFVQMDGNGNSWELVKKLRLGSCMILVDSDWILWHNLTLNPWEHYVPVKNDLSNLAAVVHWCLSNDREASQIARRGQEYALSIDFDSEARSVNERIVPYIENFDLPPLW